MTLFTPGDWPSIKLVVFDVDGTLYAQRPVRLAMAMQLGAHLLTTFRLRDVKIIADYRRIREELGDSEIPDFEPELLSRVEAIHNVSPSTVAALIEEWIENRPLPHVAKARVSGIQPLISALSRSGRKTAAWSDYPVEGKLSGMGLEMDHGLHAGAKGLGKLKPSPDGLIRIMAHFGVTPAETLMVGDRAERDGEAATRAGTRCILRASKPVPGYTHFSDYTDALFQPILAETR